MFFDLTGVKLSFRGYVIFCVTQLIDVNGSDHGVVGLAGSSVESSVSRIAVVRQMVC